MMPWRITLLTTALVWSLGASEEWTTIDEDGYKFFNPPGQAMSATADPYIMSSFNYPLSTPNKFKQRWWFVGVPVYDNANAVLRIICNDIRLPLGECKENSLTLFDGEKETVYCGDVKPFTSVTEGSEIRAELTATSGQAFVNCSVQAFHINEFGEEVTTPKPKMPTYLIDKSEEVDSEEHGASEGEKGTTCPCGWSNKVTSRIVNGTDAAPNEFPFAAALVEKESLWQFCGATLITTWHALTAAHCTIGWREGPRMALIVGQYNLNDDVNDGTSQVIDVQNIVEHSGYAKGKFVDDIALLILKDEVTISRYVGPACLPLEQHNLVRQYIKIIGWGAIYWRGPGSDILQKVDVRVVDRKECHKVYPSIIKEEDPTHLCTYAKRKASCQGDSGGPVVWVDPETNRYTVVGIVSFGRVCADNSPSVHTDVGAYLDWIQHFVSVSKPNSEMCYKKE